ncbi:leucine--tRNA ligase [bacterium]|nr:leucine--tRNA ligase [bacterium]
MEYQRFNPIDYEKSWREKWETEGFHVCDTTNIEKKYYCLDMFPYPSGSGLHVGHWRGYVLSDVWSRFKMMQGYSVLHPMGWDAFGLPAENDAIKKKTHPRINTDSNIENMKRQLKEIGAMYDWTKEIDTTDPEYYRWTQWIFVQMYKKGLAYRKKIPINWCPSCKTGLSNEEVVNGSCERCSSEVTKKDLMQWMLKITKYADRLVDDLDKLDWPNKVKLMQRNWIGRSEGAEVDFKIISAVTNEEIDIRIYTTRPDTLFGATYMVLAPEHPIVDKIVIEEHKFSVENYIEQSRKKSDLQRSELEKEKTGQFTGSYAINPVNGEKIPVWISDYVLMTYGTGAIMSVPAHDKRDFEFATKFDLPIREVISNPVSVKDDNGNLTEAFSGEGIMVNSGAYNGLESDEGRKKITADLEKKDLGCFKINYKLRDWVFARQRYWGEPIPIVHCDKCGEVPVNEEDLPIRLPDVENYEPTGTGESPLAAIPEFVNTTCPKCSQPAKRETNTMPQWAGSCWYFLRYIDPGYDKGPFPTELVNKWHPVDQYVGGIEHAILHLLYARFYTKFLFDIGVINFDEPFKRLFNQGMVCKMSEKTGKLEKMSKSKGNVANPDELVEKYGTDAVRLYELFIGPPELDCEWSDSGIIGIYRFLKKSWDIVIKLIADKSFSEKDSDEILKARHRLIFNVNERLISFKFNTAISAFMEFMNIVSSLKTGISRVTFRDFTRLLAPFAPHMACELWERLGEEGTVFEKGWPEYDMKYVKSDEVAIGVQILGKLRGSITISVDATESEAMDAAMAVDTISRHVTGKDIRKIIYVKGRILNIIV